jgi:hypothetical protein
MIQRRSGGGYVYPPRVAEPRTGATELQWVEASGLGTVYSTTVIRQKPWRQLQPRLDRLPRVGMMARVEACARGGEHRNGSEGEGGARERSGAGRVLRRRHRP